MYKIMLAASIILTSIIAVGSAQGQGQERVKKEDDKPKTTTIDAWRNAIPDAETVLAGQPVNVEPNISETVETPLDIETKIRGLEITLMDALRRRDANVLNGLLADDFLLAGIRIPGKRSDKLRYIDWASTKLEIKSYNLDKTIVRVFPTSAFVTYFYQRQASIGGVAADGEFIVTDVWGKRGDSWQVLSHHIGPSPKP